MAKIRGAEALSLSSLRPETLRGRAGCFRVGQTDAGQWWLMDPHGRPFFMKAAAAVNRHGRAGAAPEHRGAYAQAVDQAYGEGNSPAFSRAASARLRRWRMNTLGPWAEPGLASAGLYATAVADFRAAGVPVIRQWGVHLPDVFDPGWLAGCEARAAAATAGWAGRPEFAGYFTDDGLGWGEARADRPSLLQVCLSLEPGYPAYHAAWEFVLAPHGGDLAALGRDWNLDIPNRETIRQRTHAERPVATPGYLRDHDRFTREFAQRYFSATGDALRRHDPDHLLLGCRFGEPPGPGVLAACVYPRVDVLSWHCHGPDFAEQVNGYAATAMPLLLVACGLANERFRAARFVPHAGPTRVERMLRDLRKMLTAACVQPLVVGYEWARWADEADEVPPFGTGLVHIDDREAAEHTELLEQINARAERVRVRAGLSLIK
jgi:hypothetical protein